MKKRSILPFLLSLSVGWCTTSWGHGPMYDDNYVFDDSNQGLSAKELQSHGIQGLLANQCVDGSANGYPCKNIDLQAFLPKSDMGGGTSNLNDIWGWTDPVNGNEIAIVGRTNGTAFVDISDPQNPVHLGLLRGHNNSTSSWRDIKVYNDHAFIVSEASSHGMQIFDLTLLRTTSPGSTLSETAHMSDFGSAHNIAINEDSGYAYVVGSNQCSGGLYMIDISSPTAPAFAGCFSSDGYTHDAQCVNYAGPDTAYSGNEICVGYNEDTITIIDVTDKSNPVQISRSTYSGSRYTHQGWFLNDSHAILIMNDELDEQGTGNNTTSYIWDVSDLDNPVETGRYIGETEAIDHNLYTLNDYVLETNYRAGLRILKTTDIANGNMFEAAYFDTIPGSDAAQFSGTWSNYPYFASGNIVLSDIGTGLFIVKPDWTAIENQTPPPPPPPPSDYCDASSNNANDEWIASVVVGSFSNASSGAQYTDFTAMNIPLVIGSNSITFTPGFSGQDWNEWWKVWIDFNSNNTFDASEKVFDSGSASSAVVNGNITVPVDATGSTRMRIAMRYNAEPSACGSFSYGEVEDYTVSFDGTPPPPPPPPSDTYENTTSFSIPDNDSTGITSPITSTNEGTAGNVSVEVNITHTWIGDLIVDVIHPDGTVYNLHNLTGSSTDNINQTYVVNAGTKAADGQWQLRVKDMVSRDTGTIDSWSITFN